MARHARLIGVLGALLAVGALAPVTGALASGAPSSVEASPAPEADCGVLKADNDFAAIPAIGPSVIEVIDPGDCPGLATGSRPLSVTAVRSTLGLGTVTTDGTSVVYNPIACRTGTDFVDYTISDGVGTATASLIVSIARPTVSPVADAPAAGFVSGGTIGSTIPVRLSWCGVPTTGASITSYRVLQSTNAGASYASTPIQSGTASGSTRGLRLSTSYRWTARAADSRKGAGGYTPSLTTRIASYQDSGGRILYSAGWRTASSTKYSGGREHYVTRSGATATLTVSNVRQFAIVASRGSGRGSFHVYVDGRRVTGSAISQRSSTASWRRILYVGTIPGTTAGSHTIQVRSTSSSRIDLDTILTLSGRPGQAITFAPEAPASAIVNGTPDAIGATSSSGLPVSLSIGAPSWPACSLDAGVLSYHGRGSCTVRATVAADPSWDAITVTAPPIDVAGLPQAITFAPLAGRTYGDDAVTVSATSDADPALAVEFSGLTPGVCSVSGTTVSILAAGTCTVRASQPGDATRAEATPVDRSFEVGQVGLTVTGITAVDRAYDTTTAAALDTTNAALVGILFSDDVTLVTGGAAGAFDDADAGSGKTVHVSGLTLAGTEATSYALTQPVTTATIARAGQAITFTSTQPANPVKDGPTYTPAATSDSGLAVTFSVESIPAGVCAIDGSGVVSFTGAGDCVVRADQAGNGNYHPAPQAVQALTVAATGSTPQTITFNAPAPATYGGAPVPLDATSDSGLAVTLVSLDPSVCTISGSNTVPGVAGTCRITASQAGNPVYAAAAPVQQTLTVNPRAITVTAVASTKTYDGGVTSTGIPTITSATQLASGDTGTWAQRYDTPAVGTSKTLTPSGTVMKGAVNVTPSYAITFVPVSTGVINPGAADHFVVTGYPSSTVAGVAHTVTVTAQDAFNNTATGYSGIVAITSSDPAAIALPASATLTAGTGTFSVTLRTAGTRSITATDTVTSSITGTQGSITVAPASASTLTVSASSPQVAGTPFTVTVTAKDAYGNTATGYTGTVHFTSSDPGTETLPGDHTFIAGDSGQHTVGGVSLVTAGPQTVTATDQVTSSITGTTGTITVGPAGATTLQVTASSPQVAGTPFGVTVTARDAFGNQATGYSGTVGFSSTDPGTETLPGVYAFTAGDAGSHTFTGGVTLVTAPGAWTVTATDTVTATITGTSSAITVTPASASTLTVTAGATQTAGTPFNVSVTARDPYGNTATGYTGTVHFTSSDGAAVTPIDSALSGGTGTFATTLKTAGGQTVTATDIITSSITGITGSITVSPGTATTFQVAGFPGSTVAGEAHGVTVTARDAYGNTATGYGGTVGFGSTDGAATLPDSAGLTDGIGTFPVTLKTAGTRSITATDTVVGAITGTQGGITVTAAPAAAIVIADAPAGGSAIGAASVASGSTLTGYANSVDAYGNVIANVAASWSLAGTTGGVVGGDLDPAPDGKSAVFTGALVGTATIHADNGTFGADTGLITVTPGAPDTLVLEPGAGIVGPGDPVAYTATARDSAGNSIGAVAATYGIDPDGSCTGASCSATVAGVHLVTGSYLGATGTATITVNPGPATHLLVEATSPQTATVPFDITVTALDAFENIATGYTGTVAITSTATGFTPPSPTTFTGPDGGIVTISVTITNDGTWDVTATDTGTGTITGTRAGIEVD